MPLAVPTVAYCRTYGCPLLCLLLPCSAYSGLYRPAAVRTAVPTAVCTVAPTCQGYCRAYCCACLPTVVPTAVAAAVPNAVAATVANAAANAATPNTAHTALSTAMPTAMHANGCAYCLFPRSLLRSLLYLPKYCMHSMRERAHACAGLKPGLESNESGASLRPETSDAVHISTNMSMLMSFRMSPVLTTHMPRSQASMRLYNACAHISIRMSVPTDLEYWTKDRKRGGRYSAKPEPASSHQASSCSCR